MCIIYDSGTPNRVCRDADQYRDRRRAHSKGAPTLRPQDQTGSGRSRAAHADPGKGTRGDLEACRKSALAGQPGRKPPGTRIAVILVDTSVWIDHLNNSTTGQVAQLRQLIPTTPLLIGDLILCEILQGLRSEREARLVERGLRRFATASLLDVNLAVRAAANYRVLRSKGATIRKTIDVIIGTFCIEYGHVLLHDDRDFEPMVRFLGLRTI